jgi:hypothetical protein
MNDRRRQSRAPAVLLVLVALLVAACSAAASPSPTPASPSPAPPISERQAVDRVLAANPGFAGIGPLDPGLIGQSAWYVVSPAAVGWRVEITKGWGDCQAGCISRHTWTYEVDGTGAVKLLAEAGDPLPDGTGGTGGGTGGTGGVPPVTIPAQGGPWITGRALAGPTCPVVQNPPDPACAERPVGGAVLVIRDGRGTEVARATTAADGTFLVAVPGGGTWTVEPQAVEGLLGTAPPLMVEVGDGPSAWASIVVAYDTGIR